MKRKTVSCVLMLALIFTLTSVVFAAPVALQQGAVLKDGSEYIAADALVSYKKGAKVGKKFSKNKSHNEIILNNDVYDNVAVVDFTFTKNAENLSIELLEDVTVIAEWKCGTRFMAAELVGTGVYTLPRILHKNKLKKFQMVWISFDATLEPGTIINGAVPKTTLLEPVTRTGKLKKAPGIDMNVSDTTGLITEYAAKDAVNGATAKIMKYAAGEKKFRDKEEWNNTIPVEEGDIFVIKVTSADGRMRNYYKIIAHPYDATSYFTARGFNVPGLTFQPVMPDVNGVRFEPTEVFENVYFIGDSWICTMLYVTDQGNIIMWDALESTDDMINILEPDMKKLGLDPARITTVFVSHGHGDHFGGAKYLQDTYGAKVYMHADDRETMANGRPGGPTPPYIDEFFYTWVWADGTVSNYDVTVDNVTFTFMHTPGHTPGSVSFFVPVTAFDGTQHTLTGWGGTSAPRNNLTGMVDAYLNSATNYRNYINANGVDSFLSMHPFVDYSTDNVAKVLETGSSDALIRTAEEMDLFCWSLLVYVPQKGRTFVDFENIIPGYDPDALNWPYVTYIPEETLGNGALDLSIYQDKLIEAEIFDNVYLVGTGYDTCLIFDSGLGGIVIVDAMTSEADFTGIVEPAMGRLGLDPTRITAVMLTHGHDDKTGFASYLKSTYGANIYMNSLDAGLAGITPDTELVEDDYTIGDFTFSWMHTPGHTPGTMSLLVDIAVLGEAHTAALWGGTSFVYEELALTNYAASIGDFLDASILAGADAAISTHPYFDFSVNKVMALEAGDPDAFILSGDNNLEFMLTSIKVTAEYKLKKFLESL